MTPTFAVGDTVRTPLGQGVVRDVRNGGRVLVDIDGRAVVIDAGTIHLVEENRKKPRGARKVDGLKTPDRLKETSRPAAGGSREVDLHGLTVDEALARAESAINDALLADCVELRLIHGRSGGRIRAALHRRLRAISVVRAFRIDPRNEGVTIVTF